MERGIQHQRSAICAGIVTLAIALAGCPIQPEEGCLDGDGDGYGDPRHDTAACPQAGADCDDHDPGVHPGAAEGCDLRDTDCDGVLGDGETDGDLDGVAGCSGDCDDGNPAVFPGAPEVCDGVVDNDCDGVEDGQEIDDDGDGLSECEADCDDADPALHALDGDGDGFSPCDGDCDDAEPAAHPGAEDLCDGVLDADCDGQVDPREADGDGDGLSACDGDCDDGDPGAYPGAPELCLDGVDQDCDGVDTAVPAGQIGFCLDGRYVGGIDEPALGETALAVHGNSGPDGADEDSGLIDNVRVILGGQSEFDDGFEGDLEAWLTFGDPAPALVGGGNPGQALMTGGDDCGPSGAWTARTFDWASGPWIVTADLAIAESSPDHAAVVSLVDGLVNDPCGGQMPSALVQASLTGVDNVVRFSVAGVDTLSVPGPGLGVWHGVTLIRP